METKRTEKEKVSRFARKGETVGKPREFEEKMDSAVFLATEEELAKEKEDDPFGSVYIYGVTTYKVNM